VDKVQLLYEKYAGIFDLRRSRNLQEKGWLDRFLEYIPPTGTVLDVGCGMGEPMAEYILDRGYRVVGIDTSHTLIGLGKQRFPSAQWLVLDMRIMDLGREFQGILAWDSLFHLNQQDQRAMFSRFRSHASPGAPLMFTSGPEEGVSMGVFEGEPLYHWSCSPSEYQFLLKQNGFRLRCYSPSDPQCGEHTIWLATYDL
jgi:2-polyprenyl-3-methyl-5-hydroxy-6-metoxy-1,4-benzoquinol methylase